MAQCRRLDNVLWSQYELQLVNHPHISTGPVASVKSGYVARGCPQFECASQKGFHALPTIPTRPLMPLCIVCLCWSCLGFADWFVSVRSPVFSSQLEIVYLFFICGFVVLSTFLEDSCSLNSWIFLILLRSIESSKQGRVLASTRRLSGDFKMASC